MIEVKGRIMVFIPASLSVMASPDQTVSRKIRQFRFLLKHLMSS